MATEVGICNSALSKIGAKRIASLTEGSKNANFCNEQYEKLRDDLLRAHVWNFAVMQQQIARLSEAPELGFQFKYRLPSDWLRTVIVQDNAEGAGAVEYRQEREKLHTDAADVYLRYVRRVADPNEMTVEFREVLATLIARELAIPIANSNTLFQLMDERYRTRFRRARTADSIEDFPSPGPEGDWVTQNHTPDWKDCAVNAFAALAEHLGCKPEDLNVDLVALVEALQEIASFPCCQTPGCSVDDPMCDTMRARQALAQFDTVDRADIGHKE